MSGNTGKAQGRHCGPRGKVKLEQLPCERFLQGFEFTRAFPPPVSHGVKDGKFQKPVKIAHKAADLIFHSLWLFCKEKSVVNFNLSKKLLTVVLLLICL